MHRHSHPGTAVTGLFARVSLAIAADALRTSTTLEESAAPEQALAQDGHSLATLNRYLNCVSPGTTALLEQRHSLPEDVLVPLAGEIDSWVELSSSFFKRAVAETVARMALRSLWTAGSRLGAHQSPATAEVFSIWTGALGHGVPVRSEPDDDTNHWVAAVLSALPRRYTPVYGDIAELPREEDAYSVARLLAQRYDEGEETVSLTAGA